MKIEKRLKDKYALALGLDLKKRNDKGNPKYFITPEQLEQYNFMVNHGIVEDAESVGVDYKSVTNFWKEVRNEDGKKIGNLHVKNPLFEAKQIEELNNTIEESIDNVLKRFKDLDYNYVVPEFTTNKKALKATTSDDHLGLEPNPNNEGLFKYEYSGKIYAESYEKVYQSVIKEYNTHGYFDLLLLDNLGDEQDGWSGFTTRGGHVLPQNMTNTEVFEVCVDTKVRFIKSIVESNIAKKVVLRKVVNDNHAGDFGHTINIAVKKIINLIYDTDIVEVDTLSRFLEHRIYGDHCFILTHGKDKKQMFKGLPLHLNDKTINFITDYIDFYKIDSKYVHVEKGDLHQIGYNKCTRFDYRNFMSFAPPSCWQQHNFGDSYAGYSIQVIPKNSNEISHTDYFLDYKKDLSS